MGGCCCCCCSVSGVRKPIIVRLERHVSLIPSSPLGISTLRICQSPRLKTLKRWVIPFASYFNSVPLDAYVWTRTHCNTRLHPDTRHDSQVTIEKSQYDHPMDFSIVIQSSINFYATTQRELSSAGVLQPEVSETQ